MTNPVDPADSGSNEKGGGGDLAKCSERNRTHAKSHPGRKGWRGFPAWERGGQWESPASAPEGTGAGKASEACFLSRKEPCAGCEVT